MIEIYLKYNNMHTFGMINSFICINNHVISCINSMLSIENERRCSRGEFSLIDRQNLTFNNSVDAKMSLEEIRSERFKDRCVQIDQLCEIIQECIKMSKNISIYSDFGRNRLIERFISDRRLWLIGLMRIVIVKSHPLDRRWSAQMKPHDRAL